MHGKKFVATKAQKHGLLSAMADGIHTYGLGASPYYVVVYFRNGGAPNFMDVKSNLTGHLLDLLLDLLEGTSA